MKWLWLPVQPTKDQTWCAAEPVQRPLVNLTNMQSSPSGAVVRKYVEMLCSQPSEALPLLYGCSLCMTLGCIGLLYQFTVYCIGLTVSVYMPMIGVLMWSKYFCGPRCCLFAILFCNGLFLICGTNASTLPREQVPFDVRGWQASNT